MTIFEGCYRLKHWEMYSGFFYSLREGEESLIADIGKISLVLPLELAPKLGGLQGRRIAILRCDDEYRIREVNET